MQRILLLQFLLLAIIFSVDAQKINISKQPHWVKTPKLNFGENDDFQAGEGYRYLLFDKQVNLAEKESFYRYTVQVLSSDGIQQNSDLNIEYDPTYQKLEVHEVNIYRNGKKINKLNEDDFKLIQKETSADRHIYDGALSALLHLSDVQKNDIIDYSFTVKGFNPIYEDQFSGFFYHKLYVTVKNFHYRLLVPEGQAIQIKTNGHSYHPKKVSEKGLDCYQWDHDGLKALSFDTNVPYWEAMYPTTSYSTFSSWKSVVDWAVPLYNFSKKDLNLIKKQFHKEMDRISRITEIIRYVQDDIRYLGLESGMSAYRPHSPQKVFKQKYGDCKDKSLLLVALLQSEGIEAYPMLVNTQWKNNVDLFTANANAFDHCVVTYSWKGKDYYVDPTISDQGGNLKNIYFPDYKKGLVLKPGTTDLTTITKTDKVVQKVEELLIVKDMEGNATLKIKTEYRGKKANEIRTSFTNSTAEEISKSYLDFYSELYPEIASNGTVEFLDSCRNTSNVVTTLERYTIKNLWQSSDTNENQLFVEIYPLELNSRLNFPQTASREMDYYLGEPEEFLLTTKLIMPEPWPTSPYQKKIDAGAFFYENDVKGKGNTIDISHKYVLNKTTVHGSETAQILKDKDLIRNELSFYLTYIPKEKSSLSTKAIIICLILIYLAYFYGTKIYKGYNPAPRSPSFYEGIGGWLIFPTISLIILPLTIIYNIYDGGYFDSATWPVINNNGTGVLIYYSLNFVFMIFLLSYDILTLIFFSKLRTGAPRMFIILIITNFISIAIEAYIANQYFSEFGIEISSRDITRSLLGVCIWVPYFIKSERVKSTFTRTYSSNKQELVLVKKNTCEEIDNEK